MLRTEELLFLQRCLISENWVGGAFWKRSRMITATAICTENEPAFHNPIVHPMVYATLHGFFLL